VTLLLAPTTAQIEAQIDALLDRRPNAPILGIRASTRRPWPEFVECRGRCFRVAWCNSELEIREQLDEAGKGGAQGLVLITPLDPASVGADVLARLPHARFEETDHWTALRAAFKARDIDPRLRAHRWLADLLLGQAPSSGYPAAAGGVLDLESAWRAAQEQLLRLPEGRADAAALLKWTLDGANLDRFMALAMDARQRIAERLSEVGGPAARLVIGAVAAGRGAEALAIALVCGVVFAASEPSSDLREAAVRLEPLVGGLRIDPEVGAMLAEVARRLVTRLEIGDSAAHTAQSRAAALLTEIHAERYAALSPALIVGLEARMRDAAEALLAAAASGGEGNATRASEAVRRVFEHDRAFDQRTRMERLEMAARLCRWLIVRNYLSTSFAEVAASYARDGGFADRARHALHAGDELPEVANAYARLREAAQRRREAENRDFAGLLRDWNAASSFGTDPLPIERVLDTVVAPLARETPVLLLVLDGLSFGVYRKLAEDFTGQSWTALIRRDAPSPVAAVAALPTVTEISRASLFCGTLTRGDQTAEKAGFASHAALRAASRAGSPPRLFHKADLGSGPELETPVRDALIDRAQRVVGIVHNAIDAQLSGSDQLDLSWSADALRQVTALLRLARDAGRAVVVIGDHGHALEESTVQRPGAPGDRWRTAVDDPGEGEIALSGGRVLAPGGGSNSVVVAWSECVRYASRRVGYHGGASPQEVLVPIGVFAAGEPPAGWDAAPPAEPAWWYGAGHQPPIRLAAMPSEFLPPPKPRRGTDPRQLEMLTPLAQPIGVTTVQGSAAPAWIEALLTSPIYDAQHRLAGRSAPPSDQLRALLSALMARSGRLSRTALAQALSTPLFRIGGLVNAARRVLNVDQAQILVIDGDDVVLDETLLRAQFALDRSS
jgi:hypothetical protein